MISSSLFRRRFGVFFLLAVLFLSQRSYATQPEQNVYLFDTISGEAESATSVGGERIIAQKFATGGSTISIASISLELVRTAGPILPSLELWTDLSNAPGELVSTLLVESEVQVSGTWKWGRPPMCKAW